MGFNEEFKNLAGQFQRLADSLPEDAPIKPQPALEGPKMMPSLTQAQKELLLSMAGSFGQSLSTEQQVWLSKDGTLAKIDQLMKTPQGRAISGALVSQLRAFIN